MVDLTFSSEDQAFRAEVRDFLRDHLPADIAHKVALGAPVSKADHCRWHDALIARGWLAPNWPKRYGGAELDAVKRFIFDEEISIAGAPRGNIPAIDLLGPILIHYGTEEQKQRFLPGILRGEDWWCQGFSEPGSGSDLASLKCRADRDGDHYIVNGTKLWTSHAHLANWMFCLVRTSNESKKQAGISFLLFPMDSPGISITPILTLGGIHTVNQVFFDNLRVPVENRIGNEGDGWRMTGVLLGHERLVGAGLGPSQRLLRQVQALSAEPPFVDDQSFRDRVTEVEIALTALRYTAYRVLAAEMAGQGPGTEVSALNLRGVQLQQELGALLMEAAGPLGLLEPDATLAAQSAYADDPLLYGATTYLDLRKLGIYGGSNEVQRNIVARRMLGL